MHPTVSGRVVGYGMVAGAEVIPEPHRVPFEQAVGALGLLLDRGLSPSQAANRQAARTLLIAMIEKMRAKLDEDRRAPNRGRQDET